MHSFIASLLCVQVSGDNREAEPGGWQLGEAAQHASGETGSTADLKNAHRKLLCQSPAVVASLYQGHPR